jgi:mediator of RNA polymerase II transcription subunit 14
MERDRVEMSVGGGTVNGDRAANGIVVNGAVSSSKRPTDEQSVVKNHVSAHTNGGAQGDGSNHIGRVVDDAPPELLQMISTEFYLPMAKLVHRSAQMCWNDLTDLVERLAKVHVPVQSGPVGMPGVPANNQTKANLEKKEAFLQFAKNHKDVFIKLLVLLEWSKNGEDVRKTIELNYWLVQRRAAFTQATFTLGQMLQDLASAQVPNPDLYTAAEVLATGKVSSLTDLGYIEKPPLSPTQVLRTLKRLNNVLCRKLTLDTEIPSQLRGPGRFSQYSTTSVRLIISTFKCPDHKPRASS